MSFPVSYDLEPVVFKPREDGTLQAIYPDAPSQIDPSIRVFNVRVATIQSAHPTVEQELKHQAMARISEAYKDIAVGFPVPRRIIIDMEIG